MDGVKGIADGIAKELQRLLPKQRKTQRHNLSLLVATMLDVRSANLMDLAAGLPRVADRIDMRYQWIARVLMNPLIEPDVVMAPFAHEVLSRLASDGQPIVLIMDQSKLNDRHQVLMLAVRHGERALPLLWRVEAGAIGFSVQKELPPPRCCRKGPKSVLGRIASMERRTLSPCARRRIGITACGSKAILSFGTERTGARPVNWPRPVSSRWKTCN